MKSSKTRVFDYDGKKMCFSKTQLANAFNSYKHSHGITVLDLEQKIADDVFLSRDAVHNWRNGCNGPSDIGTIKRLADSLEIDIESLLTDYVEEKKMSNNYSDEQLASLKKICDALWDYLFMFSITEAFTSEFDIDKCEGYFLGEGECADYQDKFFDHVSNMLQNEYFELHGTEVYDALESFLIDISADYDKEFRFLNDNEIEQVIETMKPNDYCCAWEKRLGLIIDEYIHDGFASKQQKTDCAALNKNQVNAFKRLYESILKYIRSMENYEKNGGSQYDLDAIWPYKNEQLDYVLKKEWFYLYDHKVYDEIYSFLDELAGYAEERFASYLDDKAPRNEATMIKKLYAIVDKYN